MSEQLLNTLKELTELRAPSGGEAAVREYLIKDLYDYADEITVDALGNLFIERGPAGAPQVLVVAHMDEVGLVVRKVDPKGIVYFEKVGIMDDRVLPGREVDILTQQGPVRGAIGTKSAHLVSATEAGRVPTHQEMWIDIGTESAEEAAALGVAPGCCVSYVTEFCKLANDTIMAKAIDNRAGCAVMSEVLKRLSAERVFDQLNLCLVGTVQEEVGARGAAVVAHNLNPNLAIVVDAVPCENPTVAENLRSIDPGRGPVIRTFDIHPSFRGCITPVEIRQFLISAATRAAIPYQVDCISGTFLDSTTLHLSKGGIPTGGICFPRRYSHSPVEVAKFRDIENTCRLLVAALEDYAAKPFKLGATVKRRSAAAAAKRGATER